MDAGAMDSGMIHGCATCSHFPRHGPCGTWRCGRAGGS
jgi:hypothetical protein